MITTRESINYQFSIIFGYSSPNKENLIVGDIVGPRNLKKTLIKELSKDVINYLTSFNAMLRDYTGSELFFVEFELINFNLKANITNIYPKSMILVPGNYKECESLMLALKPDVGILDIHKSNKAITKISKLFFEVEDYANHPELTKEQRELIYTRFASRFTKSLYSQLIENKWNKGMIGLSDLTLIEKEYLEKYCKFRSKIDIQWHKDPVVVNLSNSKFDKLKNSFEGKTENDHLKFSITEPSANFIIEKTMYLGTNLLNLANTGTIDYFQNKLIKYFIKKINEDIGKETDKKTESWMIQRIEDILLRNKKDIEDFLRISKNFQISGEVGTVEQIVNAFEREIKTHDNGNFSEILDITKKFITQMVVKSEKIRANELISIFNYFSELVSNSIVMINTYKIKYFVNRKLGLFAKKLLEDIKIDLLKEPEPSKILGQRIIENFYDYILKEIDRISLSTIIDGNFNDTVILKAFKELISKNIDIFFNDVELKIKDIVSFAEINLYDSKNIIKSIEEFKKFSEELHFLLSYILRYSTINRFLKEIPNTEISDPVLFSTKFHRFLEKRLSGITLTWKKYILEWIKDYSKIFLKMNVQKKWSIIEIYNDFIGYLEDRERDSQNPDKFLEFLDHYIAQETNEDIKKKLIEFFKQYEYFLGIKTEFPKYIKRKIEKLTSTTSLSSQEYIPIEYLKANNENTFYNYMRKNELRYFSKLIPIPKSLILKHIFTSEEKELFKGELFQVFNIKYWGEGNILISLSDNFKEVYREWIKEL
ncbi:MAG: hypothetical protein JXA99_00620 [Candidatus Lokiarchaeota archaeon]|nr:hypothetical protein [Candidatus Lokiarchaeota archaeon]